MNEANPEPAVGPEEVPGSTLDAPRHDRAPDEQALEPAPATAADPADVAPDPADVAPDPVPIGFAALDLDERLLRTLTGLGYEEPTPIQEAAIPPLVAGRDLLAEAPTGTGKTAAFALPILQHLARRMLSAGQTLWFGYRVILHAGETSSARIPEAFESYGHPPVVEVTAN